MSFLGMGAHPFYV